MPTLRDDIIEARDRVIEARKPLVSKLVKHVPWTRDEEIIALDGMDSLVTMANETLPFIPNSVASMKGKNMAQAGIPVIDPDSNVGNRSFAGHVKMVREGEHTLFSFHDVRSIEVEDDFVVVRSKEGTPLAAYHNEDVVGVWMDVPEHSGVKTRTWAFKWNADGVSDDKLTFENVVPSKDGSLWIFQKTDGNDNHMNVGWAKADKLIRFSVV